MTKLGALLLAARRTLAEAGVETPDLDARVLLAQALGLSSLVLATEPDRVVTKDAVAAVEALIARRAGGEPVDRILGRREFWGLSLDLGPATLSPRPDTETLIEAVLDFWSDRSQPLRILDLGTGTGAILIALLSEYRQATGLGIDIAPDAVRIARENAARHGLGSRVQFQIGHWAEGVEGPFDLIVSNPPYIETAALPGLAREVREHDPLAALDGGPDGLSAYRAIADAAPRLLAPDGLVVLELGAGQEADVTEILRVRSFAVQAPARRDLGGVARALLASFASR